MPADPPRHQLEIHYCDRCGLRGPALALSGEILDQWADELASVTLVPTADERFDVILDAETVFSMADRGRPPEQGEINTVIESRLGPPPGFGA